VASSNIPGTTRLTEAQARALADWWGGRYHQVTSPDCPGQACHGVIIEPEAKQDSAAFISCQRAVFSLEEAQALEKARGPDNPGAPDWVG
jgi:hypothetical protein